MNKNMSVLIYALPLSFVAEALHKYVFSDMEFAVWIGVSVALDTVLGIWKHAKHKDASSETFFGKFARKIGIYLVLLILANVLSNYTVQGEVVGVTQWVGTYLCTFMIVGEAISILENVNAIYPLVPAWLLRRLRDFNDKGEYVNKKKEEEQTKEEP